MITEIIDTQNEITTEEKTTKFERGSELIEVELRINGLSVSITQHKGADGVLGTKRVRVHGLQDTQLIVFDKVSKKITHNDGSAWTTIDKVA